jgi:hypothetical protein
MRGIAVVFAQLSLYINLLIEHSGEGIIVKPTHDKVPIEI